MPSPRLALAGRIAAGALCAIALAAAPADAANILINGDFDSDLSPWETHNPALTLRWASLDAAGSPDSGSLEIRNHGDRDNGGSPAVVQCVPVNEDYRYVLRAAGLIPAGQERTVHLTAMLGLYETSDCSGSSASTRFSPVVSKPGEVHRLTIDLEKAPPFTRSVQVLLTMRKVGDGGEAVAYYDDVVLDELRSDCLPDAETHCLFEGRFGVEVEWLTRDGTSGRGKRLDLTANSGLFWFFSPDNVELLVKVLDGCLVTGRVWVFAAATTDVSYRLTVTDTLGGQVRQYINPQGERSAAIADTGAFDVCATL